MRGIPAVQIGQARPMHTAPFDPTGPRCSPARGCSGPGPSPARARRDAAADARPPRSRSARAAARHGRAAASRVAGPRTRSCSPCRAPGPPRWRPGSSICVAPGETIVVANAGFFGARMVEIARRHGVNVIELKAEQASGPEQPDARRRSIATRTRGSWPSSTPRPRPASSTRSDTSGWRSAVRRRAADGRLRHLARGRRARLRPRGARLRLLVHAEVPRRAARDGAGRALGPRSRAAAGAARRPPFGLDLTELERYWIERPATYHHTAPILNIYALHEALRQLVS